MSDQVGEQPKGITKRDAITIASAGVAGVVALGVRKTVSPIVQAGIAGIRNDLQKRIETTNHLLDDPQGKFLTYNSITEKYEFSEKPEVVKIEITKNLERIEINATPEKNDTTQESPRTAITPVYAVRVAGGQYSTIAPDGKNYGHQKAPINGTEKEFGVWFRLTDESGKDVNINSSPIDSAKKQKPVFISGSVISVIPQQSSSPSLAPKK